MRIVIVEDEALIREGLARTLGKVSEDYDVIGTAADGEAGYELIQRTVPDLVIMDIRMPKMNGLEMMRRLRQERVMCKVIVLSAYSDFSYAQEAIRLGIVNYLLKPINFTELKNVLRQVKEMCENEERKEKIFSRDGIFWGIINGRLHSDTEFDSLVQARYGFSVNDPASVFMLWLGRRYESHRMSAGRLLEDVSEHAKWFDSYVMELEERNALLMVVYRQTKNETREYFQKSVVPMLVNCLGSPILAGWRDVEKMRDIRKAIREMEKEMQWGLMLDEKTLICREEIEKIHPEPFRYPLGMEDEASLAMRCGDAGRLVACYRQLFSYCMRSPHEPSELKKCLIRFGWAVIHAGDQKLLEKIPEFQHLSQKISTAVTWAQIAEVMDRFFSLVFPTLEGDVGKDSEKTVSEMVQKAQKLIEKYYDQGVTLEEIAGKLFVSGEYLSAQFRKETGETFTGTVRKYRIAKVKKLLLETHLKLGQIAELAGYSDPKYMSRVFKEETGMLPSEYRKSMHRL